MMKRGGKGVTVVLPSSNQANKPKSNDTKVICWNKICCCCKKKTAKEKKSIFFGEDTDKSFRMIDEDNSGTLTYKEIMQVFAEIKVPITEDEAKDIIRRFDVDGDGNIGQEEFQKFVKLYLKGGADDVPVMSLTSLESNKGAEGSVTAAHFAEAAGQMTGLMLTPEETEQFLQPFFTEGTTKLTKENFAKAMMAFMAHPPGEIRPDGSSVYTKASSYRTQHSDKSSL